MRMKRTVLALFMCMLLACVPLSGAFAVSADAVELTSTQVGVQDSDVTDEAVEEGGETPDDTDSDDGEDEDQLPVVDLAKCEVAPIESLAYDDGEEVEPDEVTLIYHGAIGSDDAANAVHRFDLLDGNYNVEVSFSNNVEVGTATVKIVAVPDEDSDGVAFTGSKSAYFSITKAENPMTVAIDKSTINRKYSSSKQSLGIPLEVSEQAGALTYSKVSGKPYFAVDPKTGKLTMAAKTPVGKYRVKVGATAAGDSHYYSETCAEMVTVSVKKAGKNTLSVVPVKKTLSVAAGKKTIVKSSKAFKVKKNAFNATVSYSKVSGHAKIAVSSTGKITVKKGLKKGGVYPVKVKATTKSTQNFGAGSTTCSFKVKVKK